MAIYFESDNPEHLLSTFKDAINSGRVLTWSYDSDGDFTHATEQWKNKAWLRPKVDGGRLVLNIIKPKAINISAEIYAIYHGRFVESMLVHCDSLFKNAVATALPASGDSVQ